MRIASESGSECFLLEIVHYIHTDYHHYLLYDGVLTLSLATCLPIPTCPGTRYPPGVVYVPILFPC